MPRARWLHSAGVPLILVATLLLGGCALDLPQSTLYPAGDVARAQQGLFLFIFWIAVAIFVIVEGLLLLAVLRFRQRRGQEGRLPAQVHGNTALEIAWTLAPAIIVVAITVPTVRGILPTYDPPPGQAGLAEAIDIQVIGHQWWWEYRYVDPVTKQVQLVTANEMHIPVGTVVRMTLTSEDVIHSFSVPRLAGTRDAIPGRENRMWFRATEPGSFAGQCKELCGLSHAKMRTIVVAEPRPAYEAWFERQVGPAIAASGAAERGARVFQQGACVACHTVRGTPAQGTVGPDLTHFGSRTGVAAASLPKDPQGRNLAKWLRNPPGVKPGSIMPDLGLSDQAIADLVVYLESLQ